MIHSEGKDVFMDGLPVEIIQDFQQIAVCFRKYIRDKAIELNSKADPEDVTIELFCQAIANNGPAKIKTVIEVSHLEKALNALAKENEEEES